MKRVLLLIIGLMLLLPGCDAGRAADKEQVKESEKMQEAVPFLTYHNDKENKQVITKMSFWDIKNNKISFTDTAVYTTVLNNTSNVIPVMWDGAKKLVLNKNSSADNEYKDSAKVINGFKADTVYGRNIEAKINKDYRENKDYNLYLDSGNGIIERKAVFLLKIKDENNKDIVIGEFDIPSYVDYNSKTGEITVIFKYFFETHASLYVAKCNADDVEKISWDEIKLSKEILCGGGLTPYPINSALIGSTYYIQSSSSLAKVDLDKKESKLLDDVNNICRSIVKEGNFVPDYPKDIMPVGLYDDILLLRVPVSSDEGMENLICAFRNDIFLGAIHLRHNDMWNVIDKNKKVIEEINVKEKNLYKEFGSDILYFPFYGVS